MTLVDTSAWIEYLRATGSPAHHRLRQAIANAEPLATTEIVIMEVLAGAISPRQVFTLRRLLVSTCKLVPAHGLADHEAAAGIYRRCRERGTTVRKLADCLIAAVAIRNRTPVMHCDRDFDVIARHCSLRIA